jgi:hypothetical protein
MDLNQFIATWSDRILDFDGAYGGQCVDVVDAWAQNLGLSLPPVVGARNFWDYDAIAGFDKIANTPSGVPSPGDVLIWGTAVGIYGHTAVFVNGDANRFTSFDENWPLNSVCHLQAHDYAGVLGWYHPHPGAQTGPGSAPNTFFGTVVTGGGDATARQLPGTDQPALHPISEGTQVLIDRWCHHPPALALNEGWPPDDKWYHLGTGGDEWIASALVFGDPQNGCPEIPDPTVPTVPSDQWQAKASGVYIRGYPFTTVHTVRQTGDEMLTFDAVCHSEVVTDPWRAQPDDRWCRMADGSGWVANAVVVGDPPAGALIVEAPQPSAPPPPPEGPEPFSREIPALLRDLVPWETSPTYAGPADYAGLKAMGFSAVLIRATNGDGNGRRDGQFLTAWAERSAAARLAGLTPIPWAAWYGPGDDPAWGGVSGDPAAYLLACASHAAQHTDPDAPAWVVDVENREMPGLGEALATLSALAKLPVILSCPGDPVTFGVRWSWDPIVAAVAALAPQLYTAAWGRGGMTIEKALAELQAVGATAPLLPTLDEVSGIEQAQARAWEGCSWWCVSTSTADQLRQAREAWVPAGPLPPPVDQDALELADGL